MSLRCESRSPAPNVMRPANAKPIRSAQSVAAISIWVPGSTGPTKYQRQKPIYPKTDQFGGALHPHRIFTGLTPKLRRYDVDGQEICSPIDHEHRQVGHIQIFQLKQTNAAGQLFWE